MTVQTALILKLGAIGDVVMAGPMATALARAHPGVRVTWLAGRGVVPLLKLLPDIDEIVEVDETALLAGNYRDRMRSLGAAARDLHMRRFDLVLNGYTNPRFRVLEQLVRGGTIRRFCRNPRERIMPVPGRYHGNEYVRLALGGDGPDAPIVLPEAICPPLPRDLPLTGEGPRVAVAPGGARNVLNDNAVRRWPLERYAELARALTDRGAETVVVGGPDDAWVSDAFEGIDGVIDLVGRTSLPDLLAVYGSCSAVVSHDSGPMHLARLTHAPVVALFGPTDPRWFVPPAHAGTQVLWGGGHLPCRPCYDGRRFHDCPANLCMADISVSQVLDRVSAILDGGTTGC